MLLLILQTKIKYIKPTILCLSSQLKYSIANYIKHNRLSSSSQFKYSIIKYIKPTRLSRFIQTFKFKLFWGVYRMFLKTFSRQII